MSGLVSAIFGGGPKAPDPVATANAQAQANKEAVQESARVNQINQVGPYGSQKWSGTIGQPDRTVTTTLSPEEQKKYDLLNKVVGGLGSHIDNRLGQVTDTPFDINTGAPTRQFGGAATSYDASSPLAMGIQDAGAINGVIADAGPVQRQFGSSGPIQGSVGLGDVNQSLKTASDAIYNQATSRLDPQWQKTQTDLETKLANQGITATSNPAAYQQAMDELSRQKNDAYTSAQNAATAQGIGLQNQLFGQNVTQGQFANTAQQQGYEQNLGRATFANQGQAQQFGQNAAQTASGMAAQAQQFGQNTTAAQFANDAAAQADARSLAQAQFGNAALMQNQNSTNAARDAAINENILARNQPINEVNSLITGNQVNTPQFGAPAQYNVNAADITTPTMQNYQAQIGAKNAATGALGSIGGALGAAAIMCWVAREVYGSNNPTWLRMRTFMLTKAPKPLLNFYLAHGEEIAAFISDKPDWKNHIKSAMDDVLVAA